MSWPPTGSTTTKRTGGWRNTSTAPTSSTAPTPRPPLRLLRSRRRTGGDRVTVYARWNGATEVAVWEVLAGPRPGRLEPVGWAPPQGLRDHHRGADLRTLHRGAGDKRLGRGAGLLQRARGRGRIGGPPYRLSWSTSYPATSTGTRKPTPTVTCSPVPTAVRSTSPAGTRAYGGPARPSGLRIFVPTTSTLTAGRRTLPQGGAREQQAPPIPEPRVG